MPIEERPQLTLTEASSLEATYKVLANATRLRLVHCLIRHPDICVGELAGMLRMKIPAVSNQLQLLSLKGVVSATRHGNRIAYRLIDPCIVQLLDYGLCLTEELNCTSQSA
jgi:DNA-binding transcriptional ArsR family regulator